MIIKVLRHKGKFTTVSNRPFEDPRLSYKAKGVLVYLLTRPEDWRIRITDLVNRSSDGKTAVYSALKDLQACGYAKIETLRKEGRIATRRWVISEVPLDAGFLNQEKLNQENRHHTKDLSCSKNGKERDAGASPAFFPDSFEEDDSPSAKLTRRFLKFVIKKRLHLGRKKPNLQKWKQAFKDVIAQSGGDHTPVKEVMEWYFVNFRDPWIVTCHAATTFCENFTKIQKSMRRQLKEQGRPTGRYVDTVVQLPSGRKQKVAEWVEDEG